MSEAAKELFQRITSDPQGVSRLIDSKYLENHILDYKKVPDKVEQFRKVYSKCVTSLANSNGGVIVWGVDCRRGDDGDIPVPDFIDPNRTLELLLNFQGDISSPPISGLSHKVVEDTYVVTFVPEHPHAPFQSVDNIYYQSIGSAKRPMSHRLIESMILARSKPDIELYLQDKVQYHRSGEREFFSIDIDLKNASTVSLKSARIFIITNNKCEAYPQVLSVDYTLAHISGVLGEASYQLYNFSEDRCLHPATTTHVQLRFGERKGTLWPKHLPTTILLFGEDFARAWCFEYLDYSLDKKINVQEAWKLLSFVPEEQLRALTKSYIRPEFINC